MNLYCEKGILHRDISKSNIMRTCCADANNIWGRLIDFDMAAFTFRDDDDTLWDRTVRNLTRWFIQFAPDVFYVIGHPLIRVRQHPHRQ